MNIHITMCFYVAGALVRCFALDTPGGCSSSICPRPLHCLSYSAESEHLTSEMKHFLPK